MFKNYRDRQQDHDQELVAVRIDRDNLANRLRDQIVQGIEMKSCIEQLRDAWDEYVETDDPLVMIRSIEQAEKILKKVYHV